MLSDHRDTSIDHPHRHNETRLLLALGLTGGYMLAEVVGGLVSGSLALLADAGHMLTDTAALWFAWMAARVVRRPPDERRTYGYHRFQIIAALINAVALLFLVGWIAYEAAERIYAPVQVLGGLMLVIAALGLGVNLLVFWILHGGDHGNLNLRAALLHVLGDLLGSAAAIVAAVVILATGWMPIDPILSLFVSVLILISAWRIIKEAVHILMEGTPPQIDLPALRTALAHGVPGVRDVHHIHVWSLSPDRPLLTLHLRIDESADPTQVLRAAKQLLRERFGIDHSTIQIETEPCDERHPD